MLAWNQMKFSLAAKTNWWNFVWRNINVKLQGFNWVLKCNFELGGFLSATLILKIQVAHINPIFCEFKSESDEDKSELNFENIL